MNEIESTLPFWAVALAMIAVATTLVAVPLLRRRAGGERATSGRRFGMILAVLLPVLAVVTYLLTGYPSTMIEQAVAEEQARHTEQDIEKLINQQKEHVAQKPDDAGAWAALGMTYSGLDRWKEAEEALARAYALQPKEALVVSAYAEALAINAGRDLTGRPMQLVREALELAPQDPKALELAAVNAFQQQEYSKASYYFRQLLKVLPEDSSYAADIAGAMREARRLAEEAAYGPPLDNRPPGDDLHSPARGTITGTVELAPALAPKVTGGEAVFLFARPVTGSGAPVAGLRTTVAQLPAQFTLDDSLAPLPDQGISTHETVTVGARISLSGGMEPMPGDLEGQIRAVTVGSQGIKLVIDTVRE